MDELKEIRKQFRRSLPIFSALGDSHRQKLILLMLEPEPKSVKELAERTQLSRPSISHHLKILKDADLIEEKKVGTRRYYHPRAGDHVQSMKNILDEIERIEKLKKDQEIC